METLETKDLKKWCEVLEEEKECLTIESSEMARDAMVYVARHMVWLEDERMDDIRMCYNALKPHLAYLWKSLLAYHIKGVRSEEERKEAHNILACIHGFEHNFVD